MSTWICGDGGGGGGGLIHVVVAVKRLT